MPEIQEEVVHFAKNKDKTDAEKESKYIQMEPLQKLDQSPELAKQQSEKVSKRKTLVFRDVEDVSARLRQLNLFCL